MQILFLHRSFAVHNFRTKSLPELSWVGAILEEISQTVPYYLEYNNPYDKCNRQPCSSGCLFPIISTQTTWHFALSRMKMLTPYIQKRVLLMWGIMCSNRTLTRFDIITQVPCNVTHSFTISLHGRFSALFCITLIIFHLLKALGIKLLVISMHISSMLYLYYYILLKRS